MHLWIYDTPQQQQKKKKQFYSTYTVDAQLVIHHYSDFMNIMTDQTILCIQYPFMKYYFKTH